MTNSISFKANYISTQTIKRRTGNENYAPLSASFVSLNPMLYEDRNAINKVDYSWDDAGSFDHHIYYEMEDCIWNESNQKFYALTTQKRGFEKLIPSKILGVAEVITGVADRIKIKFLQVDPKTNMHSDSRKYKGAGSAIIEALKSLFPNKDIVLESVDSAIDFYESNGFKRIRKGGSCLIFKH